MKLKKGDINGNTLRLIKYFGFKEEQDVPIKSFEIETNGSSTGLVLACKGKYKSALFLLYLSELTFNTQPEIGAGFHMNSTFRKLTVVYFGDDLCNDAMNNPQTKHTTIRDLLADGRVIVHINCK